MIELTYIQLLIFITILWIIIRVAAGIISRQFSFKRELQLLLVYICIIVIARYVYFPFRLVDGVLGTLKLGISKDFTGRLSLVPFIFLSERYDGWLINVIGNIAMFIPVGIVWPICFKKLDSFIKTVVACAGFSLLIEVSQLFSYENHSDIDDLILNTIGAAIGAAIVFIIRRLYKKLNKPSRNSL